MGFPHIAQKNVNDSTLDIQSMILTNPTPHSFDLQQQSVIRSGSSYHPRLDAFNATLSVEDAAIDKSPFASMQLPAVHATAEAQVNVNQIVQITDMGQFTDYTKVVLASEKYRIAVRGRIGLHESGLPATTVDYNKVVTLKGMLCTIEVVILALIVMYHRFERAERFQRHILSDSSCTSFGWSKYGRQSLHP